MKPPKADHVLQTPSVCSSRNAAELMRRNLAVTLEAVPSSIREWGFKIPVLVRSDGEVVDGHLRIKAAVIRDPKDVLVSGYFFFGNAMGRARPNGR